MIIVRLRGGLGNQMFQYALGRRLALENHTPLKLDTSEYKTTIKREYKLNHFNIAGDVASKEEVEQVTGSNKPSLERILYKLKIGTRPYYERRVVQERVVGFDPRIMNVRPAVYLDGYWQSEKYFSVIGDTLRRDFTLRQGLSREGESIARGMLDSQSVSIHVRRGDYVTDPIYQRLHGLCPLSYYIEAIGRFERLLDEPRFFVFSDDLSWARDNLELRNAATFVDQKETATDCEDLILMSYCKNHIIANSSFSWWGAWLSANKGGLVLAPSMWFKDERVTPKDLIPESWQRIKTSLI